MELKYKGKGTELIPSKDVTAEGIFEQAASIEMSYFYPYATGIIFERAIKKYNLIELFFKLCMIFLFYLSE